MTLLASTCADLSTSTASRNTTTVSAGAYLAFGSLVSAGNGAMSVLQLQQADAQDTVSTAVGSSSADMVSSGNTTTSIELD